jgi:hypothetical protein
MAGQRTGRGPTLRRLAAAGALVASAALAGTTPAGAGEGDPVAVFQARVSGGAVQVSGTYTPLVGNFAGSTADDIFWYAPGPAPDSLWISTGRGTFTKVSKPVNGTYTPLVGDFGGDRYHDILWYAPGTAADSQWTSVASSAIFTSSPRTINGTYSPVVLDNTLPIPTAIGGGPGSLPADAIVWYRPGTASDFVWLLRADGGYSSSTIDIPGSPILRPISIDGNPFQDLLAYSPGTGPDTLFTSDTGAYLKQSRTVNGTYTPYVVGGGLYDEVLWHGPGGRTDSRWANLSGTISNAGTDPVTSAGPLVPMNQNGASAYLYDPSGPDRHWLQGSVREITDPDVGSGARPFTGDFDGDLGLDVFFYRPGSRTDIVAYGAPVIVWTP